MVLDPSPADLAAAALERRNLKVLDGAENRTIFFGMDQFRDELPGSNVKGKNPLKDVRVRKALYQAIDINSDRQDDDARPGAAHRRADRAAGQRLDQEGRPALALRRRGAKKLLAEAGYPQRLRGRLRLPQQPLHQRRGNLPGGHRDVGARSACKAKLRTLPLVTYFPMIQRYEASIYMLGWGVPTFDALYSPAVAGAHASARGGDGNYNVGRYSNPQMDALVERIKKEIDQKMRNDLIEQALLLSNEDVSHIPLHNQVIPWAMKKNIDMYHRADNRIDMRADQGELKSTATRRRETPRLTARLGGPQQLEPLQHRRDLARHARLHSSPPAPGRDRDAGGGVHRLHAVPVRRRPGDQPAGAGRDARAASASCAPTSGSTSPSSCSSGTSSSMRCRANSA